MATAASFVVTLDNQFKTSQQQLQQYIAREQELTAKSVAEASASGVEVLAYGIDVEREQQRPIGVRLTRSLPVRFNDQYKNAE